MNNHPFIRLFGIFILVSVLLASCAPEEKASSGVDNFVDNNVAPKKEKSRFRRTAGGPVVLLALGESWASRPEILKDLLAEYGNTEEGGMLKVLRYPEDFRTENRVRLSVMTTEASDASVSTLVALGTPEGTSREFLRIRSTRPEVQLVSVFPADATLFVEAASDIVIDQAVSNDILAEEGANALEDSEVSFLLLTAFLAAEQILPGISPVKLMPEAIVAARKKSGRRMEALTWKFHSCIDPDSGLKAFNHLLLDTHSEPAPDN